MKILLLRLFNKKLYLQIEKSYISNDLILPIGCDCHPAYVLTKTKLRKYSLPFDWLNVNPIEGIKYVTENIKTNFKYFLNDLIYNEQGYIISSNYKYAEFLHFSDLIDNKETSLKLLKRSKRFQDLFRNVSCTFLYNITSSSLTCKSKVDYFFESLKSFQQVIKEADKLLIYIRYDENLNENKEYCEELIDRISNLKNIQIANYVRQKNKFGIWGNEKQYLNLLKSFGIKIHLGLPKVAFTFES